MDPQATWDQLQEAYRLRDWAVARELAQSLLDWLARGGFPPVISEPDRHNVARLRATAIRFCKSVLQHRDDMPPVCECFRP